jgi:hypothetical protein
MNLKKINYMTLVYIIDSNILIKVNGLELPPVV